MISTSSPVGIIAALILCLSTASNASAASCREKLSKARATGEWSSVIVTAALGICAVEYFFEARAARLETARRAVAADTTVRRTLEAEIGKREANSLLRNFETIPSKELYLLSLREAQIDRAVANCPTSLKYKNDWMYPSHFEDVQLAKRKAKTAVQNVAHNLLSRALDEVPEADFQSSTRLEENLKGALKKVEPETEKILRQTRIRTMEKEEKEEADTESILKLFGREEKVKPPKGGVVESAVESKPLISIGADGKLSVDISKRIGPLEVKVGEINLYEAAEKLAGLMFAGGTGAGITEFLHRFVGNEKSPQEVEKERREIAKEVVKALERSKASPASASEVN